MPQHILVILDAYFFVTTGGLLTGCLHDTCAAFIPVRVLSSSLLWLCIRLHDTSTKSCTGAGHTGASSPRLLYRGEIFIPLRKLVPVSCKRGTAVRSSMKSLPWESRTGSACAVFDIQSNMASPGRHNHVGRNIVSIHVNTV